LFQILEIMDLLSILKTKIQQENLKGSGKITGWFSLPRGWPPKDKQFNHSAKVADGTLGADSNVASSLTKTSISTNPEAISKKRKRGKYKKWSESENFKEIAKALKGKVGSDSEDTDTMALPVVSRSTLYSIKKQMKTDILVHSEVFSGQKNSLTSKKDREEIANIICLRDLNNNGMSRKEVVSMIQEYSLAATYKKAEDHFDYLIKKNFFRN